MSMKTKTIGRMPTDHGPYDPQLAYGEKFVVTLFGCGWESKENNNTSAPATLNEQTGVITPNANWIKRWGSYEQWLIDNGYKKVDAANVKDGNNTQHEINNALANEIGTDSTPSSIKGRVANLESAVGSGGSVDSRIASKVNAEKNRAEGVESGHNTRIEALETAVGSGGSVDSRISSAVSAEAARAQAAEADRYTKSETYTKTEVNDLVDTPHQEYVTVDAYANLPATGSKDTIYRVSNYNGSTSQVDASVYSEYAWNGSQYVFLCVKSQIGEVFDISAYNNNAKYANLAAALNGGANIPQSLQKGGMSVKFVQTSDKKYVQYRYTGTAVIGNPNPFLDTANWQGVDDKPTAGSKNLVESGGVSQVSNGLSAKCGIFRKVFSVTAGSHSSNNDRAILSIPAGVPVILCLKNVTTSNSGSTSCFALFKGDTSITSIGYFTFDIPRTFIFDKDVELLGFYWPDSVGTTSGDVAIEVETYDEGREYSYNPFNIAVYVANGADFVWTDINASIVTINDNIIVKHLIRNNFVTIEKADVLAAAEEATGFSVSGNNITFPNMGTMYYDIKTQTIGFVNNTVITDNDRYIALFENHYTSYKRGLLVDYMLAKRFNMIAVLASKINANTTAINNLNSECDDINLYIRPVNIKLTTAAASQQYYPIVIKQGNYSIKNNGALISSLYLCSSVSDHGGNRVVTIGEIQSGATVNFTVERDDIVCLDGWWPADTDFQIIYNNGISYIPDSITELQNIVKTKRDFTLVGDNETFTKLQFVVNGNSKYRIIPGKIIWAVAMNTKSYDYSAFEVRVNDSVVYNRLIRRNTAIFTALEEYIDIDIPDMGNISIVQIGIRAVAEENVSFELLDITSLIPIVDINSLFANNSDDEFEPKIRTLKKKTPYNWSPVNTPLVLLWFSDLHNALVNLDRINMWKNKYTTYIDDIINTGDTISDNLATYDNDMDAYFEEYGGDKMLLVIGNHDVTSPNSSTKSWDGTQSIVDMYDKYIDRMDISELGIVQPSSAAENGYCYYYKDYIGLGLATSGIRLIVIDSCITDAAYQTSQLVWFSEVLADARTQGYPVIVASHFMPIGCNEFDNAQGFAFPFNNDRGTIIGREYRCGTTESINSDFIDAIDTHINNNGEFICWLCGHTHADHVGIVPSHPNQLVVAVTSANNNVYGSSPVEPVRVGKAQDGFNMIEVDTYSKQIKLVRVGYNIDALGREINMITLDYQNKKVII